MNTAQLLIAAESTIGLLVLWTFVFVFWKDYCLDAFRNKLFELRDELFLYAAEGNISFEHPAYKSMRERFNLMLRYAHEFTLTRFLLALKFPTKSETELVVWEEVTASLPKNQREKLNEYRAEFAFCAIKYMVLRSFVLAILVLCVRIASGLRELLRQRIVTTQVVTAMEQVEAQAVAEDRDRNEHFATVGA